MTQPVRNFAKPFAIAGFILAELYMLFAVLAPNLHGAPTPVSATVWRVAASALFLGPFGAAAGTGVGLLVSALVGKLRR